MLSAARSVLLALLSVPAVAQRPVIDRIDPPNWFTALPAPMLLIHGTGLRDATFSGAPSTRTITSPNGHWAILELDTRGVVAQTLHVTANTAAGSTSFEYVLSERRAEGVTGFSPRDVMMCIMPDRFADGDAANDNLPGMPKSDRSSAHAYHGGDLKGVIDHLDYLQQLGVSAVWLTPILANNPKGSDYHGYGAVDMYAVEPRLGTLADYQRLATELHKRHMKLLFDDVPNHVGPAHPWVADPPLPDWFHGSAATHTEATYDFGKITDPHLPETAASSEINGWFANILPDMNQQNSVVAQYELQDMIWWIEQTGLDGLRIDTFPFVQRPFWQSYLSALQAIYPRLKAVGEVDSPDPVIDSYFAGDRTIKGIDTHLTTPFDYPYFFALRDVLLNGKPFSTLESIFRQDWLYPHPELLVTILGNHDQVRFMSEKNATADLFRLAIGITLTVRGTPQLYSGDEVLMQGAADPDNRRDFPGGFAGDAINAFEGRGLSTEQRRLHDFVSGLTKLRAETPALQGGTQQDLVVEPDVFAYVRTPSPAQWSGTPVAACSSHKAGSSVLIVVNRAEVTETITIPSQGNVLQDCSKLKLLFGEGSVQAHFALAMPPLGFAVFRVE